MIFEALQSGIKTHSPQAMVALGRCVGREMILGRVRTLALFGDLGAGKTTLLRGIAESLGIDEVSSPSFNYYFLYKSSKSFDGIPASADPSFAGDVPGSQSLRLLHLDAYRLSSPSDYPSLMIDELLTPETLFVIEWPEKLGDYLPKDALCLRLDIKAPGVHEVRAL